MNSNPQNVQLHEQKIVVLRDEDISTEQLGKLDRAAFSSDKLDDASSQANGQNQQNFQNN